MKLIQLDRIAAAVLLGVVSTVDAAARGSSVVQKYMAVQRHLQDVSTQGHMSSKSAFPSLAPSDSPRPTITPQPSPTPTASPAPSSTPSVTPTGAPSTLPTGYPTEQPSSIPSAFPTTSMAPTVSPAPTMSGYTTSLDVAGTALSTMCPSATNKHTSIIEQVFEFEYFLYTNSGVGKSKVVEQRCLQAMADHFLKCFPTATEFEDFQVLGFTTTLFDETMDAPPSACDSAEDGTLCYKMTGSFVALLTDPDRRKLETQNELADPALIMAFYGFLKVLFAGTQLADDEIALLSFDGFINGRTEGGTYAEVTGEVASTSKSSTNTIVAIVAAIAVGAIIIVLVIMVVVQRRKRRMMAGSGGQFHDLDSVDSWIFDPYGEPKPKNTAVEVLSDLKALESSMQEEFSPRRMTEDRQATDSPVQVERSLGGSSFNERVMTTPPHRYTPSGLRRNRSDQAPDTVDF